MPYYEFLWTGDIVRHLAEHGGYIMAVYEELDQVAILPVTAYEVREPH